MIRSIQDGTMIGAAYILAGLSILACGYYGFLLGGGGFEGGLYCLIFAAFDTVKFNLPTVAEQALTLRNWGKAVISLVLFAALAVASLFCEIGIYATTVAHTTAPKLAAQEGYRIALAERAELEKQITSIGNVASFQAKANLAKLQQDKLYTQTRQCTDASLPESRLFCKEWEEARGKVAAAQELDALRRKLDAIKEKMAGMDLTTIMVAASPQTDTIAATMATVGISVDKGAVPTMLAILIAALMETAAVIFWLKGAHQPAPVAQEEKPQPKEPPAQLAAPQDTISAWMSSNTAPSTGSVSFAAIKEDCAQWAIDNGFQPMSETALGRKLGQSGLKKTKVAGRVHYEGIRLTRGVKLKVVG